jgi:hypothetical protein
MNITDELSYFYITLFNSKIMKLGLKVWTDYGGFKIWPYFVHNVYKLPIVMS